MTQWTLTEDALESNKDENTPEYIIPTERLLETTQREDGTYYDWPLHMAEKTWVQLDDFLEAFSEAVKKYDLPDMLDENMLARSFQRARKK